MRFSGKTVVVTGAGRGIGAETARRFAAEGANAVIADINMPAAVRVAASIEGSLAVEVDVTLPWRNARDGQRVAAVWESLLVPLSRDYDSELTGCLTMHRSSRIP